MTTQIRFPTQGELLKFIFQSTGILPNRHQQADTTQKEIERIQTQLRRLAKEDGDFLKNFEECQFLLRDKLSYILQDDYWVSAIGQSLLDLFQCYLDTIHREGTFRDKHTNIAYLIELVWLPRLAMSIFKYKWLYHQHFKTFKHPDVIFWFLGQDQKTPLAIIIDWIYHITGYTTTIFHASPEYEIEQRDLENVRHWRQGKHLPTWHDLQHTFQRAMQLHQISLEQQQHFIRYLFLARWATAILQQFDNANLDKILIDQFKQQFDCLERAFLPMYQDRSIELEQLLQQKADGFSLEQNQEMYDQIAVDLFFKYLTASLEEVASFQQQSPQKLAYVVRNLSLEKYPPIYQYCLVNLTHVLTTLPQYQALDNEYPAIKNMMQGYNIIWGKQDYHADWLQQYEQSQANLLFPWLKNWVLGRNLLLQQQFKPAYQQLKQSFVFMKYAACYQYRFLDDYLVVCAKSNQWKDFCKALSWARYMNHFGQWQGKISLDREDHCIFQQCQNATINNYGIFLNYKPTDFG